MIEAKNDASLLDSASVLPSGDRLDIRLKLTDEQVRGLITRRTFAFGMYLLANAPRLARAAASVWGVGRGAGAPA